jgi:hypothetical protein
MKSIITYHTYNAGSSGLQFCLNNPLILQKILYFSICSAIGQSFIFFTIANFDPLVCTTVGAYIHTTHPQYIHTHIHLDVIAQVTTSRKVFSALLLNGHKRRKLSSEDAA